MDYVIAVQAPAYRLGVTRFATESAFAEHLRELRQSIGPKFTRLVLIAPQLTQQEYSAKKDHLGVVDAQSDEVVFLPAHVTSTSARAFWLDHARPLWKQLRQSVRTAGIVHSGLSDDLWRPLMAMVNLAAWLDGRPVIFVVDIDFRQHARRYYQIGDWSLKSYLVNRFVYDPIKWVQVWLAPRMFQLVLLKSASMVRDFGRGRPNVKNFYDTVHGLDDVLTEDEARRRLAWLRDPAKPLQLAYFGRFVPYKGLDRAVEAVRQARAMGADVRLMLIGEGECDAALRQQVVAGGLDGAVSFEPQVRYGAALFERLSHAHLAVATPLVEDTPRAAFDAMARGMPIVGFDICYFRDLAQDSGAVVLADWPDASAMARQLVDLSRARDRIADMAERAVVFARRNTQAAWLQQRAEWVLELTRQPQAAQPSEHS